MSIPEALMAARPYVECCTEPHGNDGASKALKEMDKAASDHRKIVNALQALRELVEVCEYVKPFAGAVAVKASVKDIRQAGRFVKAVERAKATITRKECTDDLCPHCGAAWKDHYCP